MGKTRRFGDLVRESGRPEVVSLWTKPEQNRPFMKAVKENRVLTVTQEPTSNKKDFGEIGFHQAQFASYLVFPRPLPKEEPRRVIGINYQLIEEVKTSRTPPKKDEAEAKPRRQPVAKTAPPPKPAPERAPKPAPQPPKIVEKEFQFKILKTASTETVVSIKAPSKQAAKQQAAALAEQRPFDLGSAVIRTEIKFKTTGDAS